MPQAYRIIESDILRWAEARKIIPNSTPVAQYMKAVSEMGELSDALQKKDMPAVKDAVGDTLVCLINMCALLDIDMVDCLEGSWNQIKNRKGMLLPSGVFVKEN